MRDNMKGFNKKILLVLVVILVSGCRVETKNDDFILQIYFTPSHHENWSWAASTEMLFDYHGLYYSQADLVDFSDYYFSYSSPSIHDISWLFWDLGGIDSYVTGTLSFGEIKAQLKQGNPILLQYGSYYNGQYIVIHGYDYSGHVYIHEPGYGTRLVHYDDLFFHHFSGRGRYWESSLILVH